MFVWPHEPNWASPVETTVQFMTEIVRSRNGQEQRIAQRYEPRMGLEYDMAGRREANRDFQRQVYSNIREEIIMPVWSARALVVAASGATVRVTEAQWWMEPGAILCVLHNRKAESAVIANRSGNTITLETPLADPWPSGARVYEGVIGRIEPKVTWTARTSEVSTIPLAFAVTPGKEPIHGTGAVGAVFDGKEVFDHPVNWASNGRMEIEDPRAVIDYEFGTHEVLHNIAFPTITRRFEMLARSVEDAKRLENFFRRHKGRQRSFYVANTQRDLLPVSGISAGAKTLIVEDREVADYLNSNTVHRAIALKTPSGVRYNRIESTTKGSATTILSLRDAWPETVPERLLGKCSFLNLANFGSDGFSLSWLSDRIATTTVTITTLEDFWGME